MKKTPTRARLWGIVATALTASLTVSSCSTDTPREAPALVRLAAHDSFVISDELIAEFEATSGYQLEIVRMGDTGSLTNQLILTKTAPVADAVYGIDNTFLPRALEAGILETEAEAINYGDVCFNYDLAWFAAEGIEPPASWRALTDPRYQ